MTITGVQVGGRDGPWMRVGDVVMVKKTGQKGRITHICWKYNPGLHKYDGHIITLEFENPCVGYDEAEECLTPDDLEFDVLEKLARIARESR
jgi:hypothetical protein